MKERGRYLLGTSLRRDVSNKLLLIHTLEILHCICKFGEKMKLQVLALIQGGVYTHIHTHTYTHVYTCIYLDDSWHRSV